MATVNFYNGMQKTANVTGKDKLMIGKDGSGEAMYAEWDQAKQFLNITGIDIIPVPPGELLSGPSGQDRKMEVGEGEWTYNGSSFTVPSGSVGTLWWDGTTWSLAQVMDLPMPTGVDNLNPQGIELPKERAVAEYVDINQDALLPKYNLFDYVNSFDKSSIISGYYIDTTTGMLESHSTSSVSSWINIKGWTTGYISGRSSGSVNNIRFRDDSGNILKPVNSSGDPLPNFNIGYQNGVFYVPANAVALQIQVIFNNNGTIDRLQVEKGNEKSQYLPFNEGILKSSVLSQRLVDVTVSINDVYVRSSLNSENRDILLRLNKSVSPNKVFNIYEAKILGKSDLNDATGLPLNGAGNDESAPIKINGMYIGANHGNIGAKILTSSGHSKTLSDVGSTWLDADGQVWILLKVISVNQLLIISTNRGGATDWDFKTDVAGNLTYQSGAINTATIVNQGISGSQLFPSIKNLEQTLLFDGKKISQTGNYSGAELNIVETYDIVDTPDMLAKLVNGRPSGGYTTQPDFTNGDAIVSIRNNYKVTEKCCTVIDWSFIIRKDCTFNYFGATQSEYSQPSWVTSISRLYPNSLPINDGAVTWDFRTPRNVSANVFADTMNLTSEYWENSNMPVYRSVDGFDGVVNVNFNIGFIPIMSQADRNIQINNAWFLYTSKKQYPYAIDNKIGNVLPANTYRSGTAFRGWSERSESRYNEFIVERNKESYIFLDYISSVLDSYSIPEKYVGKDIEIYDKSSNVTVLTDVIFDKIDINVGENDPQFGRVVILVRL